MPRGHLVFVFTDGVGIGVNDPTINPFITATIPTWQALAGGIMPTLDALAPHTSTHATVLPADATLGVEGVPQSGTGTTALLTGLNAPLLLGRHDGPYPPSDIQPLLKQQNLLTRAHDEGYRVTFANAFPPFYFERLERGKARRTTCTQAALAAGIPLRTYGDLLRGNALSGWITNEPWARLSSEVAMINAYQAGENLARLGLDHDVTLFEYFHTDHIGHRVNMEEAHETLVLLDNFIAGITATLNPERDLLVIAADHGNFEDQSQTHHTLNPTLVTIWGDSHATVAAPIRAITDIVPQLWAWLTQ